MLKQTNMGDTRDSSKSRSYKRTEQAIARPWLIERGAK
jgi:hypothetical protein